VLLYIIVCSIMNFAISMLYLLVLDSLVYSNVILQVTEYAPLKSLLECLHNDSLRRVLNVNRLCTFAHQIATGMTYLEAQGLIHRDLAARNILVFSHHKVGGQLTNTQLGDNSSCLVL